VTERQWGTVREDYSANGDAWRYFPHEHARSRAYRWGEDGIGGWCDDKQDFSVTVAFWNGKDPILKERFFGLANHEGNHGEDIKELHWYLDGTPTSSFNRMLYKYPQESLSLRTADPWQLRPVADCARIRDPRYRPLRRQSATSTARSLGPRLPRTITCSKCWCTTGGPKTPRSMFCPSASAPTPGPGWRMA